MKSQNNLLNKRIRIFLSKKIMVALFAITLISTSAFASGEEDKARAFKSLKKEFSTAKEIEWKLTENYIKASFKWNGQQLELFYNYEGENIAKSRHINAASLPLNALQKIYAKYPQHTIEEAIEYNNNEGDHYYYASVIKGGATILLQITTNGEITVFEK